MMKKLTVVLLLLSLFLFGIEPVKAYYRLRSHTTASRSATSSSAINLSSTTASSSSSSSSGRESIAKATTARNLGGGVPSCSKLQEDDYCLSPNSKYKCHTKKKKAPKRKCVKSCKANLFQQIQTCLVKASTNLKAKRKQNNQCQAELKTQQTQCETKLEQSASVLALCDEVLQVKSPITETFETDYTKKSSAGPFKSNLKPFSEDITKPYASSEELRDDLEQAAWFMLNQVVKRYTGEDWNLSEDGYGPGVVDGGGGIVVDDVVVAMPGTAPVESVTSPDPNKGNGGVSDNLSDYGTNNQEDDVEEGDIVVSDGEIVYAAYGNYLVIWNGRQGKMVAKIKMPDPNDMLQEDEEEDNGQTEEASAKRSSMYYPYYSMPKIKNLVLDGKRLLVIMDGYGQVMQKMSGIVGPIFYDHSGTHLRLYDTDDLIAASGSSNNGDVDVKVIGTANVHGRFGEVRAVNGNAHVMTVSNMNARTYLDYPFSRHNFPFLLTDEEYVAHVYQVAKDHAIPFFTKKLLGELVPDGEILPNLARISLWQTAISGTGLEGMTYDNGVLNAIAQVHSFSMDTPSDTLDTKSAGCFLPTTSAKFYGNNDAVVIAGQGWNYIPETWTSTQTTYLLAFKLDGASSLPHAVGMVDGYLLNNHAVDIVDNVLRVATSSRNSWRVVPMEADNTDVEIVQDTSTTQNYIITLGMPDFSSSTAGVMEKLGHKRLGEPNELFTAVRFFDNIAYAVTYERKDPLYVVDLENPKKPEVLGVLEVSGFSSYLHSMNAENSLILAIGQEADKNGVILGVALTVFDVTDPTNPIEAKRHTIEKSRDLQSNSLSLSQFKATRYAGERLIIPMDIWGYNGQESFHGFLSYHVTATSITEECKIPHVALNYRDYTSSNSACYYCANLQPRSMIFDGNLMTMNNHFIRSNDMNGECKQEWSLDIEIENPNGGCCRAYGYWW